MRNHTIEILMARTIIDLPQTRNHTRRARVHKPARQADEPLSTYLFPKRRLAGTQHNEISFIQVEAHGLVCRQNTILHVVVVVSFIQQVTGTTALNAGKINAFLTTDVSRFKAYDAPFQL